MPKLALRNETPNSCFVRNKTIIFYILLGLLLAASLIVVILNTDVHNTWRGQMWPGDVTEYRYTSVMSVSGFGCRSCQAYW